MAASNFDSIILSGAGGLSFFAQGTTPATGWTVQSSGAFVQKTVTVVGARVNDCVQATYLAAPLLAGTPVTEIACYGLVTANDTVVLYVTARNFAALGAVSNVALTATLGAAVAYCVSRQ